jgi:two-component system cell cycle sensor histidine kinase/response regulator CckA
MKTILVVDDEDSLRTLIGRMLEREGYSIVAAANAAEGIRLAASHNGAIDLIVADLMMPGMNGPEMVKELLARRPNARVLYLSGYPDDAVSREGLEQGANFLQKPFGAGAFIQSVRDALGGPEPDSA